MNFYFNYFCLSGERVFLIVSVSVSTLAYCLSLKKLTSPTEFVDSFLEKLTLPPRSVKRKLKCVAGCCIFQINVVSLYSYNAMVCGESMPPPEDIDNQNYKHIIL